MADRWENAAHKTAACMRCGASIVSPGVGNRKHCVDCAHALRLEQKRERWRKKAAEKK